MTGVLLVLGENVNDHDVPMEVGDGLLFGPKQDHE